ncbi:MAG: ExbD/TolR family protein [Lacipirellulaceae bacterium]
MRLVNRRPAGIVENDMTPMIDMAFQLIAFFMVLVNFSDVDNDQRVSLPSSELAKPPDAAYEEPITVQIASDETILFGGEELTLESLKGALRRETKFLEGAGGGRLEKVTVVIRADLSARAGKVQEVIQICQDAGLDKFALRGKQSDVTTLVEP